jgi:hypothetical protein
MFSRNQLQFQSGLKFSFIWCDNYFANSNQVKFNFITCIKSTTLTWNQPPSFSCFNDAADLCNNGGKTSSIRILVWYIQLNLYFYHTGEERSPQLRAPGVRDVWPLRLTLVSLRSDSSISCPATPVAKPSNKANRVLTMNARFTEDKNTQIKLSRGVNVNVAPLILILRWLRKEC